jgi:integrase
MPIFQVIRKGDNHMSIEDVYNPQKHNTGKGKFHPDKGLYRKSIGDIVYRRTAEVLGKKYACKPHDCRRTFAYIAYTQGMPLPEISKALRHADTSITWQYIGTPPEYTNTLITNYIQIA